jgi:hypothetical protein
LKLNIKISCHYSFKLNIFSEQLKLSIILESKLLHHIDQPFSLLLSGGDTSFNGNIEYIATSTGSHIFYTTNSTTERMRILQNGNVGINNTNLDSTFSIYSTGNTTATTSFLIYNNSNQRFT